MQPLDLWANLPPVIYYFSLGTNKLPVCSWVFTVRVSCLVCSSWRNVCSQNGVRINKQLFLWPALEQAGRYRTLKHLGFYGTVYKETDTVSTGLVC